MDKPKEPTITIPFKLFTDNAWQPIEDKELVKFIYPAVSESTIVLWERLNSLFLQYYPSKLVKKTISPLDSVFYQKEKREIVDKLSKLPPSQWNEEIGERSHLAIEKIRDIKDRTPRGYLQFLKSKETQVLSADLDRLVHAYPDFWKRLPIDYWEEGVEIYDKSIKLIESLEELIRINEQPDIDPSKCNPSKKKSTIKLKFGEIGDVKIDGYWRNLIISGILNEAQNWFAEANIPIDILGQTPAEAKNIIKQIKEARTTMKKDNPDVYVTGNLVKMLEWPGAKDGNSTVDSAEFIMRFIVICGFSENNDKYREMIKNVECYYKEAVKDRNGRPVKNSSYNGERREVSECIRSLNNSYKKYIAHDN